MIEVAQKTYKESTFICDNMIDYTRSVKQESKDIVVALASIQHLQ